jgi:uncharacterized Fe-S radical SAM superfamily protein PflX
MDVTIEPEAGKVLAMAENPQVQTRARGRPLEALHGGGRFVRLRRDFVPTYLRTFELGELGERVAVAQEMLHSCKVCRRDCRVNRWEGQMGVCKTGRHARVSSAFLHLGEEGCLRGWEGSGTIFFAGCNLGCVFCQNYLNLMDQYHPAHRAETEPQFSGIRRRIFGSEFRQALVYASAAGLWRLDEPSRIPL